MTPEMTKNKGCRICGSENLVKFLSLGETPPANNYPEPVLLQRIGEKKYPLDVYFCPSCTLVQLRDVVNPEILFRNYLYASSTQATLPKHFVEFACAASERFALGKNSLVVEIGSNDGTLLKAFQNLGVNVIGIDPALNLAQLAIENGVETICELFATDVAGSIAKHRGKADMIIANNVLAHLNNLHDVVDGMKILLNDNGVISIEVPYILEMLEHISYDSIYHEHLSYFAIKPLKQLFEQHNMEIFDIEQIGTHGGSVRIYVCKTGASPKTGAVERFLAAEKVKGVDKLEAYQKFASDVLASRERLVSLLQKIKSEGKSIAGYSAPAKSSTLLNFCGLGKETIDFISDMSTLKRGRLTPGSHIPIFGPEKILEAMPDYVIIFAWNLADEIMKQLSNYKQAGGKFIIPSANPVIV